MNKKIDALTTIAQDMMTGSRDPIHDIHHVRRVVAHVQTLSKECSLTDEQTNALVLAAWWHDVSRTLTRKPSIVIMPFVDDLLSALMLWYATIRCGLFGSITGMATRMIFCKSFGAGKLLTRILMRRHNRIMVDILHDADTLDVLHIERNKHLYQLADSSRLYHWGYKVAFWWFLRAQTISVKTEQAKKYLLKVIEDFFAWMSKQDVFNWHVAHYGLAWTQRQLAFGSTLIARWRLSLQKV